MHSSRTFQSRNDGLDILKCICAFLVVTIHKPFPSEFGQYFRSVAHIAVPAFFLITGYFYFNTINRKRDIRQIKRIFILFLVSNVFYFCFYCIIHLFSGTLSEYFVSCFSLKSILQFVLLNESPFGGHLWYLGAILYVLIIVVLLRKLTSHWEKILYYLTPLLLIGDLVLGKYSVLLWGYEPVTYAFIRNFLFVGIPYFSIGVFLFRHQNLIEWFRKRQLFTWVLVIFFVLTTILERFILVALNANATRPHCISTTLLSVSLFIAFSNPVWNERNLSFLKTIGRKYSLAIYVIHPAIMVLGKAVFAKIHIMYIYEYLGPILVFAVSLFISMLYYRIKEKLLRRNPE